MRESLAFFSGLHNDNQNNTNDNENDNSYLLISHFRLVASVGTPESSSSLVLLLAAARSVSSGAPSKSCRVARMFLDV